ncbi:MAG: DEAD/DEAH box helicase family protein [Clostridia bacterium]|nr:DEAD/DEAH box helicase family protein [Clostridia bacterium]
MQAGTDKDRKDLEKENRELKERVEKLEQQVAELLKVLENAGISFTASPVMERPKEEEPFLMQEYPWFTDTDSDNEPHEEIPFAPDEGEQLSLVPDELFSADDAEDGYEDLTEITEELAYIAEEEKEEEKAQPAPEPLERKQVTAASPMEDKLELFRSLFKGRPDVFAKRWQSKAGKSGYSPVCANEWSQVCDKRNVKCKDCKFREWVPLEDKDLVAHFKGAREDCRDVVGIYPMLDDDMCSLLVADFDDDGWQKDVKAFRQTCANYGLNIPVERSRSGDGGHGWFFFTEPVKASAARRLASFMMTGAMSLRHEISLASYDRFIPVQDFLPNGSIGNLVALPLQGRAVKQGNSMFIDENFNPYEDQWAFLSGVEKISPENLESILHSAGREDVGTFGSEDEDRPWAKKRTLIVQDFPEHVNMVRANMVYIEKDGFSEYALNVIKRFAAFPNPEFYKKQKMRLPVYNIPRIIDTHEENGKYIMLPRGCFKDITALLNENNIQYTVLDERNCGKPLDVTFLGELREEQVPALEALAAKDMGVLSATTGFGKTVIAARLIAEKKRNTLILVHTSALLSQWKDSLMNFLDIRIPEPEENIDQPKKRGRKKALSPIGQLGASRNTLNGYLDIALMQSLADAESVKDLVKDYGMVIVDECHHVPADSFERVMKTACAKYVYGLTATPIRQDGHQKIIFMQCGDVSYSVSPKEQAAKHGFDHIVMPRFTTFRLPLTADSKESITEAYEKLCASETRNRQIVTDVEQAVKDGRHVIVLTERRTHAQLLQGLISDCGIDVVLLLGSDSAKVKKEKLDSIRNSPPERRFVIVATGKYVGEGFDEARLDTLFLAMPVSYSGKITQYTGRLHRKYEGKESVIVYDYVDVNVGVFDRMYQRRVAAYRYIGYEISFVKDGKKSGVLFDKFEYGPVFDEDIISAQKSVVIVCPVLKDRAVGDFITLVGKLRKEISITIVARAPEEALEGNGSYEDYMTETLKAVGVQVAFLPGLTSKFAVIDDGLIWYGSIGFLSYTTAEESTLRFYDTSTAEELLGMVGL